MIRVLVVDDSAVAREVLTHLINSSGDMTVIGVATNGREAIEATERLKPDIVTMDIMMPQMDGPEAIDAIMHRSPVPIVVVTGNTITEEVRATFQSLESGALAIIPRPSGMDTPEHEGTAEQLLQTLRLMSEVKVVRRLKPRRAAHAKALLPPTRSQLRPFRVVAIGASTGGPTALKGVLGGLRRDFPTPVLIVQHIAAGFVDGFVNWLRDSTPLQVEVARDGVRLAAGTVYVAPENAHLTVTNDERVALLKPAVVRPAVICPSANELFRSVTAVYGREAIGILLTGMGRDGADGLHLLHQKGAITAAQDKESSVIHGMPGEAIALGAADFILSPPKICDLLTSLAAAAFPIAR